MSRISLADTAFSAIVKMADGNPGAITAISEIMKHGATIDPQSVLPDFMPILSLDTHGIYGSDIYVLYSDKCGRDVRKLLVLLRAVQLGIMQEQRLRDLATDQTRQVKLSLEEFDALDVAVCTELSEFQRPAKA